MDIGTILGLVVAVGAIGAGIILGGGNPAALIDVPSIAVVFGGTTGAIIVSFPIARVLKLHSVVLKSVFSAPADVRGTIAELVQFAEVARREGILSLEGSLENVKDDFIVRGIKMAVDGTDPELIRAVMETELEALMERHMSAKMMLDAIARFAPAFGMIGTLMGLIFMLQNMDDPSAIGPGMAVALITTMYGAIIANVAIGPVSEKLYARDQEEIMLKTIIISGVMSIQSGDNPRVVEAKLLTFLPPSMRDIEDLKAA